MHVDVLRNHLHPRSLVTTAEDAKLAPCMPPNGVCPFQTHCVCMEHTLSVDQAGVASFKYRYLTNEASIIFMSKYHHMR